MRGIRQLTFDFGRRSFDPRREQIMKLLRGMPGTGETGGEQAGDPLAEADNGVVESPDEKPDDNQALKALFARADEIRMRNGLGATTDSSVGAQIVVTALAMEVLGVGDKRVHPEAMDSRQAALAWAYVCCMSAPVIAIVDKRDDFDHQAFVLAVASAVLQFYDPRSLVQIIQDGTVLFHNIVMQGEQSQAFVDFNDRVHALVLAYLGSGGGDAIAGLRERYSAFARLVA
jgi:hypothetical protein